MSKLPQVKPQKVVKVLQKLGFQKARQTGSHLRLAHADGRRVTIAIHNQPLPKGTLKSILNQANITVDELQKFL